MKSPFVLYMKVKDGDGKTIQKYSVHELSQEDLVEVQEVIIDALKPLGRAKLVKHSGVAMGTVSTGRK